MKTELLLPLLAGALSLPVQAFTFDPLPLPDSMEQADVVRSSPRYRHADKPVALDYQVLMRSGDRRADQIFGLLHDRNGNLIHAPDGGPRISRKNDFSSLLKVDKGLFMLTQFEEIPGSIYLSELTQDRSTGKLNVTRTRPLDLADVNGGWNHCAGRSIATTRPWRPTQAATLLHSTPTTTAGSWRSRLTASTPPKSTSALPWGVSPTKWGW
ncbi:MAG: hypothetical protein P8Z77_13890 [Candidatus Thiodiazotropha sp.]